MARNSLRTMEKTADAVERVNKGEVSRTVAQRSAEGTAEFGQTFSEVFKGQTQHNVETLNRAHLAMQSTGSRSSRQLTGSRSLRSRWPICV